MLFFSDCSLTNQGGRKMAEEKKTFQVITPDGELKDWELDAPKLKKADDKLNKKNQSLRLAFEWMKKAGMATGKHYRLILIVASCVYLAVWIWQERSFRLEELHRQEVVAMQLQQKEKARMRVGEEKKEEKIATTKAQKTDEKTQEVEEKVEVAEPEKEKECYGKGNKLVNGVCVLEHVIRMHEQYEHELQKERQADKERQRGDELRRKEVFHRQEEAWLVEEAMRKLEVERKEEHEAILGQRHEYLKEQRRLERESNPHVYRSKYPVVLKPDLLIKGASSSVIDVPDDFIIREVIIELDVKVDKQYLPSQSHFDCNLLRSGKLISLKGCCIGGCVFSEFIRESSRGEWKILKKKMPGRFLRWKITIVPAIAEDGTVLKP